MRSISPGHGQFRWMVLLLVVAVILPTVCLLWFMGEVVGNERLVVRQKLTQVYKTRLAEVTDEFDRQWAEDCDRLEREPGVHPYQHVLSVAATHDCTGLLLFDAGGRRIYPALSTEAGPITRPSEVFADAWEMEFVHHEYERAAERYEQYARISDDHGRLAAIISKSRALHKLGERDRALTECERAAFPDESGLVERGDSRTLALIARARLLLLGWLEGDPAQASQYAETLRALLAMLYTPNAEGSALPTDENLFLARKVLEMAERAPALLRDAESLYGLGLDRLIRIEERAIALAERFPTVAGLEAWESGTLRPLELGGEACYAMVSRTGQGTSVMLLSPEGVTNVLAEHVAALDDSNVDYAVLDETGRLVAGVDPGEREPFAAGPVGAHFPGWSIQVFFQGGDVFERAAGERIAVYTWTGMLVIVLILVSGAVAAKSIGRQVRLNRLKNDFIATVTHELKTPLASMRVLVDTLLEGHYRDRQQATEYLQLVSRENERLSRLIDNFLTFSRMERNKQAFQMERTNPLSIARAATEAVKAKFERDDCRLETEIADDLPSIQADHDAMVTVLVNLLDNAYKYSNNDRRIRLSVGSDNGSVQFRVTDNGLGIPRRAARRIFRRFYQVDRSLSRRAEGCGLGLSIAKFIVDAHHGTIAVDSRPGQGSTFTVTLPPASEM